MKRITSRDQLIQLADELGVRPDWHEPDEQGVTTTMHGVSFDNAGFWGPECLGKSYCEQYITLYAAGEPVAYVNLATLFAFATGYGSEVRDA